jgi:hypothetical protein
MMSLNASLRYAGVVNINTCNCCLGVNSYGGAALSCALAYKPITANMVNKLIAKKHDTKCLIFIMI